MPLIYMFSQTDQQDMTNSWIKRPRSCGKDKNERAGTVVENFREANGARRWRVKFDDGYVGTFSELKLHDMLVVTQSKTKGKQLNV